MTGPTTEGRATARPQVVVVGDAMVDVLVEVRAPFAHASDTPSRVVTSPGGSGANQAVWLSRSGAAAVLVAVVGTDPFGSAAIAALVAEGVGVAHVHRSDLPTGTVVALVEPDGQRSMLTDRGANLAMTATWVADALGAVEVLDHVHVSGYGLLDDATRQAGAAALAVAAGRGATRSVDASSAGPLRAMGPERFLDLARGCDVLFCNLDEGEALTGRRGPDEVLEVLADGFDEVVCTLGPQGARAATGGVVHTVAPRAAPVADTVGAGDAFAGSYLAARLSGGDVAASLDRAIAAAATCVTTAGARSWGAAYSRE